MDVLDDFAVGRPNQILKLSFELLSYQVDVAWVLPLPRQLNILDEVLEDEEGGSVIIELQAVQDQEQLADVEGSL